MKTILATALAGALLLLAGGGVCAATLTLLDEGLLCDSGPDAKYTLAYPELVNAAKKNVTIQTKTITGQTATLTYAGGAEAVLVLRDGELTFTFSGLAANIKMSCSTLRLPTATAMGATWAIGGAEAQVFPKDQPAKPCLFQGNSRRLELTSPSGVKTVLQLPDFTYQQLQDNRAWNASLFQWQCWMPCHPASSRCTIKFGNATATAGEAPVRAITPARSEPAPGPDIGATKILKWQDGKQAVFMLEFDDSCESHIKNVIPELKKRGLVGTFYINPGNGPFKNKQAAWEKDVPADGMELANHTFTHTGALTLAAFERELALCNAEIDKCFPDRKQPRLISYGPPGVPKEKWGIGTAEIKPALVKFNLIERPSFFGPPFHQKSKAEVLDMVDQTLARGEMGHLDFHGVGGDWHVTPMDWFLALLDKLAARRAQLWITDPISWHKYLTERQAATVQVLAADARQIRLQLSCTADPALYDQPLSLATRVPPGWTACLVTQGAARTNLPAMEGMVRYPAQPGTAEIVLRPELP